MAPQRGQNSVRAFCRTSRWNFKIPRPDFPTGRTMPTFFVKGGPLCVAHFGHQGVKVREGALWSKNAFSKLGQKSSEMNLVFYDFFWETHFWRSKWRFGRFFASKRAPGGSKWFFVQRFLFPSSRPSFWYIGGLRSSKFHFRCQIWQSDQLIWQRKWNFVEKRNDGYQNDRIDEEIKNLWKKKSFWLPGAILEAKMAKNGHFWYFGGQFSPNMGMPHIKMTV